MIYFSLADIYKVLCVVLGVCILCLGISTVVAMNSISQDSLNSEKISAKKSELIQVQVVEQLEEKYQQQSRDYEQMAIRIQENAIKLKKLEKEQNKGK